MSFLRHGTSYFIGTYWDVHPETAHQLGVNLLRHLLLDLDTISGALTSARRETKLWLTRNRATRNSTNGDSLPTCPDWAAYTLSSTQSGHTALVRIPAVRFHYSQPSLHQLYFVRATPGGYERMLQPHPLAVGSLVSREEGSSGKVVHVHADTVDSFRAQKQILSDQGFVILGTAFATGPEDDGIVVPEERAGQSLPLRNLSDIQQHKGTFLLAVVSKDFYLVDQVRDMLEANGLTEDKVVPKSVPDLSSYPSLLKEGLVHGAWMFGAGFHSALAQQEVPLHLLEGSSVCKFSRGDNGPWLVPVVIAARQQDVEKYPMLFRNLLYRIKESMHSFQSNASADREIASEMGIPVEALQELRRAQCPTAVFLEPGDPLQDITSCGLEAFLYRKIKPLEPAWALPSDIMSRQHDSTLCVCGNSNTCPLMPGERPDELTPERLVISRRWLLKNDVMQTLRVEAEQWPTGSLALLWVPATGQAAEAERKLQRRIMRRTLAHFPVRSLVSWTGEDQRVAQNSHSALLARTIVALVPLIEQAEAESILRHVCTELQEVDHVLPLGAGLQFEVAGYVAGQPGTEHRFAEAFEKLKAQVEPHQARQESQITTDKRTKELRSTLEKSVAEALVQALEFIGNHQLEEIKSVKSASDLPLIPGILNAHERARGLWKDRAAALQAEINKALGSELNDVSSQVDQFKLASLVPLTILARPEKETKE
jgi:hypothetical protein